MSQPKRYRPVMVSKDKVEMHQCISGDWTSLSEYYLLHDRLNETKDKNAALAAENERLRSKLSFSQSISEICNQQHEGETITVKGAISSGKTDLSSLCQCDRLAAENERLKASQLSLEKWIACEQAHFETANNLREKLYQASLQIERLRQAGDVLMQCYCAGDLMKEEWKQLPSVAQWLAAKEGRDAK